MNTVAVNELENIGALELRRLNRAEEKGSMSSMSAKYQSNEQDRGIMAEPKPFKVERICFGLTPEGPRIQLQGNNQDVIQCEPVGAESSAAWRMTLLRSRANSEYYPLETTEAQSIEELLAMARQLVQTSNLWIPGGIVI